MNREKEVLALRPSIDAIDKSKEMSSVERFQNITLRPILKLQSDILIGIFTGYSSKRNVDVRKMSILDRTTYITNILQKDIALRNVLIGNVLGMMTPEEITIYFTHESESRNRISKMIIQRLSDLIS